MKGQPLSPEQKERMRRGRQEARARRVLAKERAAERTMGQPSAFNKAPTLPPERHIPGNPELAALEAAVEHYGDGSALTRESRVAGTEFDVPKKGQRLGWDYQWWPTHYMGQEIDPSFGVEIQRGGWIPVPASHFPQLCPRGWRRATIDRQGQRLFMRPMRLTEEAKAEQHQMAYEQKANRLAAAQAGDTGLARRVNADGSSAARIDVEIKPLI